MKEKLIEQIVQAREDINLVDGGDNSFHYYEGLIDGLTIALELLEGEGNENA
jgi:hypothetical protein